MKPKTPPPSVLEHISKNYKYDPETGEFWRRAGILHPSSGYNQVAGTVGAGMDRTRWNIKAHRLAFLLMTGSLPGEDQFVDHINRDRADNRWCNLRLCTASENAINRTPWGKAKSRGVQIRAKPSKPSGVVYTAEIGTWPNRTFLGYFDTEEEAANAYNVAAIEKYGAFANLNE